MIKLSGYLSTNDCALRFARRTTNCSADSPASGVSSQIGGTHSKGIANFSSTFLRDSDVDAKMILILIYLLKSKRKDGH